MRVVMCCDIAGLGAFMCPVCQVEMSKGCDPCTESVQKLPMLLV
jgi:hypothetical protein